MICRDGCNTGSGGRGGGSAVGNGGSGYGNMVKVIWFYMIFSIERLVVMGPD